MLSHPDQKDHSEEGLLLGPQEKVQQDPRPVPQARAKDGVEEGERGRLRLSVKLSQLKSSLDSSQIVWLSY